MTTNAPEIIFFGRLEERKGLLEFLDAINTLAAENRASFSVTFLGKDVRLYSAQTGRVQSSEYIARKLSALGQPVRLLTDLSSEEAISYVKASPSCVVCLASPNDNFPNTGLEMGQIPVPLVVSDTLGFHQTLELVGRREGLFWFRPGSADSLCVALARALDAAGRKFAVPTPDAIKATNEGLAARRLELIEQAFAEGKVFQLPTDCRADVVVLAEGDANAVRTSLQSLEKTAEKISRLTVLSTGHSVLPGEDVLQREFPKVVFLPGSQHLETAGQCLAADGEGTARHVLFLCAGTLLQPDGLTRFLEAALRTKAALAASAEWEDAHQESIRTFDPPSLSLLLRSNESSGSCILVDHGFLASLPPPTMESPPFLIWQLTVAAAVTGSKYAYLPYPQYSAPAGSSQSERPLGADGHLVLLSRYAAGIKPERWVRRELFGLALSTQQLAENLRQARVELQEHRDQTEAVRHSLGEAHTQLAQTRAALQEAERQCAGVRQELAAVYRSKSWRSTALLRVFYKAAAILRPRSPVQPNSDAALPMRPQTTFQRPAVTMQASELFPSLDEEIGPWKKLLRGRVLNAGAGNRDLSPLVEGELTNQDIPHGLHNANIHIHSPLHRIPREDAWFDTIFCNAVLEHVNNPEEIVAEFARVCRPGGHLYLCAPFLQPEHKDPIDHQRYTADGLAALVERHGFQPLAVEPVHNIYTTLGWIIIAWLSFSDCRRNLLLRRLLYPLLRHLSRHSKEQVPAAASGYRVIAIRREDAPRADTAPRADVPVVMALREV